MGHGGALTILQQRWFGARALFEDAYAAVRGEGLGAQMVRGGAWTLGLRVTAQVVSLAQVAVLARLLAPTDFGLIGIALLAVAVLDIVTDGGLAAALVQRRDDPTPYLNTIFTAQLVRGLAIALGLVLAAPAIAAFFDNAAATDVVRAMAVFVVVRGFSNPAMILYTRSLAFRPGSISALCGLVATVAVTIPLAFLLRDVWALLLGMIASQVAMTVVSYVLTPSRPSLDFDWVRFRELTRFGKWVTASNIAYYVLLNGDSVLVGKILGTTPLGFYRYAFNISNLPATEITRTLSQVSFPAYAAIQHDREGLSQMYLQVLRGTALLSLPAAIVLLVSAPDLIAGVLGAQWQPALGAFQVLCVFAASRSIIATSGPLFQGAGRPSVPTGLAIGQLAFLAAVAYPATRRWELEGIATAVTVANGLALAIALALVARLIEVNVRAFAAALWPGARAAALFAVAILPVRLLVDAPPLGRLGLEMAVVMLLSPIVLLPLARSWKRSPGVAP